VTRDGTVGLRKHRSHEVVAIDDCRIADPRLPPPRPAPGATTVETLVSSSGERLAITTTTRDVRADGPEVLHEAAAGRTWQVTGSGFWQVHPGAAGTLATAVLDGLRPRDGERALDLYAGVGLFSAPLADAVGPAGHVVVVEADEVAAADAVANLADLPQVEVVHAPVSRALRAVEDVDLVVLDPPRTGAKAEVVTALAALAPRAVAYVACDPAALARDLAYFAEHGYQVESLRAFDLFPMTQHVECVAVLSPTS
jgi:tRNA/tmRNA/rRNA uracil-C5-methylase (TrmA/RlmC/RlmD family)